MKLEITTKKENKALQRKEVMLKIDETKVTPSRKELLPKIAAVLDTKEQLVVINKISHPFGSREATIEASVYENENALKNSVAKHLIERGKGKKKKEEEKKPEAKEPAKEEKKGAKEEKPTEKKEEKAEEEKNPGKKEEKPAEEKKEEKTTEKENKEADK